MGKVTKRIFIAMILFALAVVVCYAAEQDYGTSQRITQGAKTGQIKLCSVNELMGSDVMSKGGYKSETGTTGQTRTGTGAGATSGTGYGTSYGTTSGETLGTVEELVIDNSKDQVYYVVIESDDKYYPVPWWAFDFSGGRFSGTTARGTTGMTGRTTRETADQNMTGRHTTRGTSAIGRQAGTPDICLNISKDQFNQAPSMASVSLAAISDSSLKQRVDTFYTQHTGKKKSTYMDTSRQMQQQQQRTGERERTQMPGTQAGGEGQVNFVMASDVVGLNLRGSADTELGSINDLMIDVHEGYLAYAIVDYGGFMGIADKTAAVPWASLTIRPQQDFASINATESTLDASVIEGDRFDRLSQPEFARRLHENFGVEPYWGVYGFVPAEGETDANQPSQQQRYRQQQQQQRRDQ